MLVNTYLQAVLHTEFLQSSYALKLSYPSTFDIVEHEQYTHYYKDVETMKDMPVLTTLPADKFDELVDMLEREHPCERTRKLMESETVFGKHMTL